MDNNKALLSLCVLSVVLMSAVLVFKQTQPGNDDLIKDGSTDHCVFPQRS
jgi:hypothetical protein